MALMKQLVFESELREPIIRVVMESTVVTPWKAEKDRPLLYMLWKRLGLSCTCYCSVASQIEYITSYQTQTIHALKCFCSTSY